MSITDELREFVVGMLFRGESHERLVAIADRIDAALEEEYIELPKDADGVPIHVGDVMENVVHPPTRRKVTGVGVECFYAWEDGCGRHSQFGANCYRHVQPDSWERIIEDAMEAYQFDDGSSEPSIGSLVERCKRLAGEGV